MKGGGGSKLASKLKGFGFGKAKEEKAETENKNQEVKNGDEKDKKDEQPTDSKPKPKPMMKGILGKTLSKGEGGKKVPEKMSFLKKINMMNKGK